MKSRKRLLTLGITLLMSILAISQVSYASRFVDDLRQGRGPETEVKKEVDGVFPPAGGEKASHLEPRSKFVNVALKYSSDSEIQEEIIKSLMNVGPAYKVVDGTVIKNPAILAFFKEFGIEASEEEALRHEEAESTLLEIDKEGILTTSMLLTYLERKYPDEIVLWLKEVYNLHYAQGEGAKTFDEDPGFALRHIIAEAHDGGFLSGEEFESNRWQVYSFKGIARRLHSIAGEKMKESEWWHKKLHKDGIAVGSHTMSEEEEIIRKSGLRRQEESGWVWKKLNEDDIGELNENSQEAQDSKKRILVAANQLRLALEKVFEEKRAELARAEAAIMPQGVTADEAAEVLKDKDLFDIRQQIDNIAIRIAGSDRKFYSSMAEDGVRSEQIQELAIYIPAKDVLENLAGFKEECLKFRNLPIYIVTVEDDEIPHINKLRETHFLPNNIQVISAWAFVRDNYKLPEKVIIAGSPQNLGVTNYFSDKDGGSLWKAQFIKFAQFEKDELLNWQRVFASLAIAILGKDPGPEKTNLNGDVITKLIAKEDIEGLRVSIKVSDELLEDAKRAYKALKTNI